MLECGPEAENVDPRPRSSMLTRLVFTDAAGGSREMLKNGVGGVHPSS